MHVTTQINEDNSTSSCPTVRQSDSAWQVSLASQNNQKEAVT